ncbi:MAG: hypothetical protein ACREQM_16990 [Candidatus Dormibacteraceae bacterium]
MAGKTYSEAELAFLAEREAKEIERRRHRGEEPGGPYVRSRAPRAKPKMTVIYSVRLSDEWVQRLRQEAIKEGVAPSTLLRRWAEERLEQAEKGEVSADPKVRHAVRLELERAGLVKHRS